MRRLSTPGVNNGHLPDTDYRSSDTDKYPVPVHLVELCHHRDTQ